MVSIILIRNTDGGLDYLIKSCRYVFNEERAIIRGGFYVDYFDLDAAFSQMLDVKRYFGKTSGNPLIHIIVSFDECAKDLIQAEALSRRIAAFYSGRYQVLWCMHHKPHGGSNYHVHIILNSVSYVDGKMFHSGMMERQAFQLFVHNVTGSKTTFRFDNKNEYRSGS